ncbi:hypothetical protein F8388_015447 [Cannabis sativa]|uniref:EXS domain-containing protein n=1 Tax=Cannabis sativa TaxID=3483 RepID=A0A7J6GKE9_CANSA|nr:hypothetical protein F8388_015447 [Cannabis sativa]
MFGGLATVPTNSPHLRKSGSRPVFSDLGTTDVENGADENFLHSAETDSLKGSNTPISTGAMMPSPIFLWRIKVVFFFIWGFICCKIGWDSVMRMSVDLRDLFLYEAFLYYNPLLLVTMAVWFWGSNLWVFSQSTVSYAKIFDLDQNHLTHREIWKAITFSDFFVADILTSMSKVLSDLERSACRMVHRQVATIAWFEADSVCGSHSVAIPIVLVLPYLFRLFQCLRQYKDTGEKTTLLNALKYSTAVPVIFLSALKYHVLHEKWISFYRPLWLLSSVLNSLYSFYWDVTRDWDLSGFTRIFKFSRPSLLSNLLFGRKWVYFWVLSSNLILRCTWTYKLSAHLRHNYLTLFTITALEIFRRFQWVFFRVENEWNKMNSKSNAQLSLSELPSEEDKLLASNNHNALGKKKNSAECTGFQSRPEPNEITPRVLTILSSVLERLVARNDRLVMEGLNGKSLKAFHGVRAPSISIAKYLERLYKYSSCSPSCFVVGYVYIDRLLHKYPDSLVVSINVHRLLVTTIMVASKMLDDVHYNNAFYARVGGVSNAELNKLEVELLFLLDFGVVVSSGVFEIYCAHLEKEMLISNDYSCQKIERVLAVDDITEISVEDNTHTSSPTQMGD